MMGTRAYPLGLVMKDVVPDLGSIHATVYGHVQGVFFRAFVQRHAGDLRLTGSVRNVREQSAVEVEAEGERSALERLLEHLHQGPPEARVDRVEVQWGNYKGGFSGFRITH